MGIGDTMRVSLSADPEEEVKVGFEILKSLGLAPSRRQHHLLPVLRTARALTSSGPSQILEERLEHIKTPMSLSIIGCVVNGPGEAL